MASAIATGLALSFGVLGESLGPFGIAGAALMVAGLAFTPLLGPSGAPRGGGGAPDLTD